MAEVIPRVHVLAMITGHRSQLVTKVERIEIVRLPIGIHFLVNVYLDLSNDISLVLIFPGIAVRFFIYILFRLVRLVRFRISVFFGLLVLIILRIIVRFFVYIFLRILAGFLVCVFFGLF